MTDISIVPHCDARVDEGEAGGVGAGRQLAAVVLQLLHRDVDGGARVEGGESGGTDGAGDELVGGPVADPAGEVAAHLAAVRHLHVRAVHLLLKRGDIHQQKW